MQRIAPWALAAVGLGLLVANLALVAGLRGRLEALREAPAKEFVLRLEAIERDLGTLRAAQTSSAADLGSLRERLDSLWKRLDSVREASPPAAASAPSPPAQETPPPGRLVSTFDAGTDGWAVADWGLGSVRRKEGPAWARRGRGALAIGYTYGDKPPAAVCGLDPGTAISGVRLYARTRARAIELAVGVECASGARYEKLVPLHIEEGWKPVAAMLSEMRPAPGSAPASGSPPADASVRAIYVADRSEDATGGNILLIDDVTVEPAK